ncbi:MAG: 16S rRNA (guanine(966)-N(2))-methyltransferase RsmD [Coriobacteriia bacterium]|nr:16S rRNA (guanine(966)-N(2))-methyltransferase RsmD [Coriobacteriia bacterium]
MRVIAGDFRGRNLKVLKGDNTRPTTDRVKESLMSSLYSLCGGFDDLKVLDAFAGSGQLGIEALSRGAEEAWFCEKNREAARVVESNLALCKLDSKRAHLVQSDTFKLSSRVGLPAFDLVFLDPPYAFDAERLLSWVGEMEQAGRLSAQALISYEYAKRDAAKVEALLDTLKWTTVSLRSYGDTVIAIFKRS